MNVTAEIIAIGDEMIGGARLDTNTQWLAEKLTELGLNVVFHSTVGDHFENQVAAFQSACSRAQVVVVTGGLGPTADDLTRWVLAEVVSQPLVEVPECVEHIRRIFSKYGREMPASNAIQAQFPEGSRVIPNSEGTAPGIDFTLQTPIGNVEIFCLPGVPAEMKEMWEAYVAPAIMQRFGSTQAVATRVVNCFGAGESQTEELLGDLIARNRNPLVGITATKATISLRITARAESQDEAVRQINQVEEYIRERLGDLVFGVGDETLSTVVLRELALAGQRLAILDLGLFGDVLSALLHESPPSRAHLNPLVPTTPRPYYPLVGGLMLVEGGGKSFAELLEFDWIGLNSAEVSIPGPRLAAIANRFRLEWTADWGVMIGPVLPTPDGRDEFCVVVSSATGITVHRLFHTGHRSFRHLRSVKQVLNLLRLQMRDARLKTEV